MTMCTFEQNEKGMKFKMKKIIIIIIAIIICGGGITTVVINSNNNKNNEPVTSSNQISSNESQSKVQEQTQKLSNEDIIYKYEEYRKELKIDNIVELFDNDVVYKYVKDEFDYREKKSSLVYNDRREKLDNMQKSEIKQKISKFYNSIFEEYIKDKDYEIHNIEKITSGDNFETKLKELGYSMTQEQVEDIQRELSNYDIYLAVVTENGKNNELNYFYFNKDGKLADIGIRCLRSYVVWYSMFELNEN